MEVIPTEQIESENFALWLKSKGLMHHHGNDNMFTKSWAQRGKMKRAGFSKGFPDFTVIVPDGICFVEMKRIKKSHTSPEQKEWIEALQSKQGVEARVCKGADEAIEFISQFL